MKTSTYLFLLAGLLLTAPASAQQSPALPPAAYAPSPAIVQRQANLYAALLANDAVAVNRLLQQSLPLNVCYQPAQLDVRATAYHAAPFLYWALLFRCRVDILKALVVAGADVNFRFQEPEDVSLLMLSAYQFPAASVRFLLDHGAEVNARTVSGRTVLMFAVTDGDPELGGRYGSEATENARLLIARGARVGLRDSNGRTALMVAAHNYAGSDTALNVLLAHGGKVNEADASGTTPLMLAAEPANKRAVQLLLRKGARVQVTDSEGKTPLLYALYPHCSKAALEEVVEILCQAGVNVNARDRQGETALDYATIWEERIGSALSVLERYHAQHGKNPHPTKPPP